MLQKQVATDLWRAAFDNLAENEPEVLTWARGVNEDTFKNLRSKRFLNQYCFVVYASGFRFSTIQSRWHQLADAWHGFDLNRLSRMRSIKPVLAVFNNTRKAESFLSGSKLIAKEGYINFKRRLRKGGVDILTELPGIGPITKDHLAKNIGLADVAKADVWLVRAASFCGAANVGELVEFLATETQETRHVIDVALWTYGRDGLLK